MANEADQNGGAPADNSIQSELDDLFDFGLPSGDDEQEEDAAASAAAADSDGEAEAAGEDEASASGASKQAADADSSDDDIPEKANADGEPAKPAKAAETPSELERLRAQNAEMQKQLSQLLDAFQKQTTAAQKPAEPQKAGGKAEDDADNVILDIPPALAEMLESEDPAERTQGMRYLASGAATAAVAHVKQMLAPIFRQGLPRMIQQVVHQQETRKTVDQDFYGKFPQLNKPELHNFVLQVGREVAAETGKKAWDGELRDAIGQRVIERLSSLLPVVQPAQPAATPAPTRRAAPPPTPRGGSPARNAPADSSQTAEIMDLFH